jgi:putative Holliday junction resolvase
VIPRQGRVAAVDWGEVRIGVAVSDETQLLASPVGAVVRHRGKRFPVVRFTELLAGRDPVGIVVGLPLTPEGEEAGSALGARELAQVLSERTGLPVELWDERLTTTRALGAIRELGGRTRGRKADVDALAATVLLQHWLEARRGTGSDR